MSYNSTFQQLFKFIRSAVPKNPQKILRRTVLRKQSREKKSCSGLKKIRLSITLPGVTINEVRDGNVKTTNEKEPLAEAAFLRLCVLSRRERIRTKGIG